MLWLCSASCPILRWTRFCLTSLFADNFLIAVGLTLWLGILECVNLNQFSNQDGEEEGAHVVPPEERQHLATFQSSKGS